MKNNINYQKILDKTIDELLTRKKLPTLVLHSCCAPCSSYVLEYLTKYFKVIVLYYNPNIYPPVEYENRVKEQLKLIESMPFNNDVEFIALDYDPMEFYDVITGLETEPEGGKRCAKCFEIRLEKSAIFTKDKGYDYFTTTLSISPLKDSTVLNHIGTQLAIKYGVNYLVSDFKKKNGYQRSIELSNEYNLYRQNYCGCIYSANKNDTKE